MSETSDWRSSPRRFLSFAKSVPELAHSLSPSFPFSTLPLSLVFFTNAASWISTVSCSFSSAVPFTISFVPFKLSSILVSDEKWPSKLPPALVSVLRFFPRFCSSSMIVDFFTCSSEWDSFITAPVPSLVAILPLFTSGNPTSFTRGASFR